MKILKYIASCGNSIELYNAIYSAVYLKKNENDVIIISPKDNYIDELVKKNKLNYQPVNFLLKSGFVRPPNPDIIEIYGFPTEIDSFIKRILNFKKPKILKIYTFPDQKTLSFLKSYHSFFNRIVVPVESLRDELVKNEIPFFKIQLIPPLLVMTRWESAKQIKPMTFLQRPYRILNVGRNYNEEDIKFFLLVAKEVLIKNDKVNFMIVGTKNENIREFARKLGISHKVDILGWRDDMPEVMAMTHIYVSTKQKPSISRSLMEAMASSVVCVIGDVAGMSDFINDYTGIIVKNRDLDDYVKNILSLISDPINMQNISSMAYAYAKANFSAEIITRVEELLYENLINEWSSRYL